MITTISDQMYDSKFCMFGLFGTKNISIQKSCIFLVKMNFRSKEYDIMHSMMRRFGFVLGYNLCQNTNDVNTFQHISENVRRFSYKRKIWKHIFEQFSSTILLNLPLFKHIKVFKLLYNLNMNWFELGIWFCLCAGPSNSIDRYKGCFYC